MRVILPVDGSPSSMRAVDYVLSLAQRIKSEPFEVDLINVPDAAVGISGFMGRDAGVFIGAPSAKELEALVARVAERIGRPLERKGVLVRDCENSCLSFDPAAGGRWTISWGTRSRIAWHIAVGKVTYEAAEIGTKITKCHCTIC